jgi:hypothetical protein
MSSVSVAQLDRASASEAEVAELEVKARKDLGTQKRSVAPIVAPHEPKPFENMPSSRFTDALLMISGLPLTDEDKAEAVRRLLASLRG